MNSVALAKGTMKVSKPSTFSGIFSRFSSLSRGFFLHATSPPAAVSLHSKCAFSSGLTSQDCAVFLTSVRHGAARPAARRSFVVRASSTTGEERVPSIGFLGLGIMGTAMARNLVKAGYDVTVWNRTPSKCDALVHEGAKHGETPEQTAATCDITFAMLADPAGAMEVACGPEGAVKGLSSGKGYVDISTVDGDTSKEICSAVKVTGAEFLEAPVSGSKKPAEDGTLIFLTAGDKALYERAAPFLDVMGKWEWWELVIIAMLMVPYFVIYCHKSRFYLGDVGNGAAMKLVVNMVMGSMMASFSEGLLLGKKAGLDPTTIIEVIGQGAISAPMFAMKGPSMLMSNYPPAFPLKHQQKDLRLALAMAEDVAQSTPVAAAVNELYEHAKTAGLGDQDFSAVIEALRSDSKS